MHAANILTARRCCKLRRRRWTNRWILNDATASHLVLKTDNKEDNERLKTWPEGAFGGNDVRAHVRNEFIVAVKDVGKAITISEEEAEMLKNRYGVLSIKRVKDRRGEDSTVTC